MKEPSLYFANVVHRRLRAPFHQLQYRLAYMSFLLEDVTELEARSRLFGVERRRLFRFHPRDYGAATIEDLSGVIRTQGARMGVDVSGPVRLITLPRVLGFGFNPISLFVLHDAYGSESAIVYDVRNTFGERYYYTALLNGPEGQRHARHKVFHVSPFLPVDGMYRFNLSGMGRALHLAVTKTGENGVDIYTRLTGQAERFSDAALLKAALTVPVQGGMILAAIHWEAFKMILKRAVIFTHPARVQAREKARRGLARWLKGAHTISTLKGGAFK